MNLLHIISAVIWVDFFTIALHRMFGLGNAVGRWYSQYGIIAVLSDCLVIILGILIAQIFFPTYPLLLTAIAIQIIHDVLFYLFVILPIPQGHNSMIDLFKSYSVENSWKILVADSIMIGSTVVIGGQLSKYSPQIVSFIGLLGAYAMTYILFTR